LNEEGDVDDEDEENLDDKQEDDDVELVYGDD
jgi:hypothetical protein